MTLIPGGKWKVENIVAIKHIFNSIVNNELNIDAVYEEYKLNF